MPNDVDKGAFGLFDYTMLPKLNRILKPHGLRLKQQGSRNWGDQVKITVERKGPDVPTLRAAARAACKFCAQPYQHRILFHGNDGIYHVIVDAYQHMVGRLDCPAAAIHALYTKTKPGQRIHIEQDRD